jgi:hypothetical protein
MDERQRMAQLKEPAAELERLPPSPERNALRREVRARAVTLEIGAPSHWRDRAPFSDRAALSKHFGLA